MLVLSYFRTSSEMLHLAISDDGLVWVALNGNKPLLAPEVGSRAMREPSIIQADDGTFHLFCADGWRSSSIVHATSRDLLHWSQQELLPVMAGIPGAMTAYAPACFFDPVADHFRITWSSAVRPADPRGAWECRVWSTTSRDFRHYTPSRLFFDPGYSVGDASIGSHEGEYLMAYRDERGRYVEGSDPPKAIHVCSLELNGLGVSFGTPLDIVTPSLVEGPSLFWHRGRWIMLLDHVIRGHLGALASVNGVTWQIITDECRFPPGLRHGSVIRVHGPVADALRDLAEPGVESQRKGNDRYGY
jgi:hypothetical protein